MSFEWVLSPAAGMSSLAGGDKAVFGEKPQVADFVPVSLQEEGERAIKGNVEAFSDIEKFLNMVVPGFTDTLTQGLGISREQMAQAMPLIQGQVPQDVQDQLQRTVAQQGLTGGYGTTTSDLFSKSNFARNVGLTSLDLMNQGAALAAAGQNSAQMWTQLAEQAFSPWTVSTSQQAALTGANLTGQQQTQQLKYNIAAAPDPAALAKYNTNVAIGQQIFGTVAGIGGAAMGGGGGGGGGGATAAPVQPTQWQYNPSTNQFAQLPTQGGTWGYGT